jgi:hypothetical protein
LRSNCALRSWTEICWACEGVVLCSNALCVLLGAVGNRTGQGWKSCQAGRRANL